MSEAAANPSFAAIGQRLREARERRGMSREAVLEKLHCTPEVLAALEQGQFERLGAPVFIRGHLRRYAELLGEPADELVAQWSGGGVGSQPDITQRPQAPRPLELKRWLRIAAYAVLALVLAALAWAALRFATPAVRAVAPAPAQPLTLPALREPPPVPEPAPEPPPATVGLPADPASVVAAPSGAVAEPAVAEPVAATGAPGQVAVTGRFSEACWVDVVDATGKRLHYGLVPAGGSLSFVGVAPLRVLLGVQSAAQLEVAGRRLALPPATPGVRSTRFRIAADGSVLPPAD